MAGEMPWNLLHFIPRSCIEQWEFNAAVRDCQGYGKEPLNMSLFLLISL